MASADEDKDHARGCTQHATAKYCKVKCAHLLVATKDTPAHVANEASLSFLTLLLLLLVVVAIGHVVVPPVVSHVCRSSASGNGSGKGCEVDVSAEAGAEASWRTLGVQSVKIHPRPHFVIVPQVDRGLIHANKENSCRRRRDSCDRCSL